MPTDKSLKKPNEWESLARVMPILSNPEDGRVLAYLKFLIESAQPKVILYTPEQAAWSLGFTLSAFNQSEWHKKIRRAKVENLNRYRPEDIQTFADNLPRSYPR